MYFYCKSLCILIVVYVFLTLSMYSYCCLCILIVRPCILNVVYVFLLFVHVFLSLSMYSYCCLCILIVVYVFLDAATLTERFFVLFPRLSGKCQGIICQEGARPALFQLLCCSMYWLFCVVLCIVCVKMCTVLLSPGDNPTAVNKYIISYHKL
jgi:hypothetical protein